MKLTPKLIEAALKNYPKEIQGVLLIREKDAISMPTLIEYYSHGEHKNQILIANTTAEGITVMHQCIKAESNRSCKHLVYPLIVSDIHDNETLKMERIVEAAKETEITGICGEPNLANYELVKDISRDIGIKESRFIAAASLLPETPTAIVVEKAESIEEEEPEDLDDPDDPKWLIEPITEDLSFDKTLVICEEAETRDYLFSQGIKKEMVVGVLKERRRRLFNMADSNVGLILKPKTLYLGKQILETCLSILMLKKNLFLSGPKGTGKNILIETLSWVLCLPLEEIQGRSSLSADDLVGSPQVRPADGAFETFVRLGQIANAVTDGKTVFADEVTAMRPDEALIFNPVLDSRRHIMVPGHGMVTVHPDSLFIFAGNIGYEGTGMLSEAVVDRMVIVETPYVGDATIKLIKNAAPSLDEPTVLHLEAFFKEIMEAAMNNIIDPRGISMRGLLDAAQMIEFGLNPNEALKMCLSNKFLEPKAINPSRDALETIIDSKFPSLGGA